MSINVDDDDVDDNEIESLLEQHTFKPSSHFTKAIEELTSRCKKGGIQIQESEKQSYYGGGYSVYLPSGREKKELTINSTGSAKLLLRIPFEKIQGVSRYRAFCSYEEGYIEAMLETASQLSSRFIKYKLDALGRSSGMRLFVKSEGERVEVKSIDGQLAGIKITIGPATSNITILYMLQSGRWGMERVKPVKSRPITIRIEGLNISRNEQAKEILEVISKMVDWGSNLNWE